VADATIDIAQKRAGNAAAVMQNKEAIWFA